MHKETSRPSMQLISLTESTTTIAAICRPSYWFFRCYFDGPI